MAKKPDRNYVQRSYLRVQKNVDQDIHNLLMRSLSDVDDQLRKILGTSIGDQIRREQLLTVKKVMHEQVSDLMKKVGYTVEQAKHDAAAAAIRSSGAYESVLMQAAHIPKDLIDYYQKSAIATAQRGVNAAMERLMGSSYVPLAKSVYKTSQWTSGVVDRYVDSALARGLSARELARGVRDMIRPDVRGGVSYAAMRLGRTEINNAFHATNAAKAAETPWVEGVRWVLSGRHPTPDDCNTYAEEALNPPLPPGVWPKDMVPMKPHPQCLCTTVNELPSADTFVDNMLKGDYDNYLDKVMARSGYSADYIKASRFESTARVRIPEEKFGEEWMAVDIDGKTYRADSIDRNGGLKAYTALENEARMKYADGTYFFDVRDAWRNGRPYLLSDGSNLFDHLDSALAKTKATHHSTLYRSMKVDKTFIASLEADGVIDTSFYSSTTGEAANAVSYGAGKRRGQVEVVMQILAPKGTRMIPGMTGIDEWILSPSASFRIRRVTQGTKRVLVVVEVEES